jgi:hypothetical protein
VKTSFVLSESLFSLSISSIWLYSQWYRYRSLGFWNHANLLEVIHNCSAFVPNGFTHSVSFSDSVSFQRFISWQKMCCWFHEFLVRIRNIHITLLGFIVRVMRYQVRRLNIFITQYDLVDCAPMFSTICGLLVVCWTRQLQQIQVAFYWSCIMNNNLITNPFHICKSQKCFCNKPSSCFGVTASRSILWKFMSCSYESNTDTKKLPRQVPGYWVVVKKW